MFLSVCGLLSKIQERNRFSSKFTSTPITLQARTITTGWHPTLFLPVTVTEPAQITHYTYDTQGRQLSQTATPR